jgi:hypothetical protein
MRDFQAHNVNTTKIGKTKERLLKILAKDRTDLAKSQDAPTDA